MDTSPYIQPLLESQPLREPLLREIITTLQLPTGSRGIDIGCGTGQPTLMLAATAGEQGHVTGVDIDPRLTDYAAGLALAAGLSGRTTFRPANANRLPFPDGSFEWSWSMDCVGYPVSESRDMLLEMARVVRPGGRVFLLGWTSQRVLPGHSLLEDRLNAACSSYLPFLAGAGPEQHFLRAARWFQQLGLEQVRARTFARDLQAPLSAGERTGLLSLFSMLWQPPQPVSEDWRALERLIDPACPDFILDLPGYYAFFTYTLVEGRLPD